MQPLPVGAVPFRLVAMGVHETGALFDEQRRAAPIAHAASLIYIASNGSGTGS